MKLSDFDYKLPPELIAQEPVSPRDHSRLLVYNRQTKKNEHQKFYDIINYLKPGDILFVNNSKVFSARLKACKKTGGEVEIFLLKNIDQDKNVWQCLIGGRVKDGAELILPDGLTATVIKSDEQFFSDDHNNNDNNNARQVIFNKNYQDLLKIIEKIGWTPLPPYIKRANKNKNDLKNYQTIYAKDDKTGSSAAPTAGLHFTDELLEKIKSKGIEILEGTLHVGLGTFSPIKTENILEHQMHSEEVEISQEVVQKIIEAKKEGRRIIAVGTTSVRILESLAQKKLDSLPLSRKSFLCTTHFRKILRDSFTRSRAKRAVRTGNDKGKNDSKYPITFSTNIFIYPGYKFQVVDGLITNFHLPKSSLIILISALIGENETLKTYQEAVQKKYRFFSYGDAMLII